MLAIEMFFIRIKGNRQSMRTLRQPPSTIVIGSAI